MSAPIPHHLFVSFSSSNIPAPKEQLSYKQNQWEIHHITSGQQSVQTSAKRSRKFSAGVLIKDMDGPRKAKRRLSSDTPAAALPDYVA
jgi:hypothetical protein